MKNIEYIRFDNTNDIKSFKNGKLNGYFRCFWRNNEYVAFGQTSNGKINGYWRHGEPISALTSTYTYRITRKLYFIP